MRASLYAQPSAWIPLALSVAALAIVVGHGVFFGSAREADEGAAAHLFQLLLAGQVPFVLVFAIKWLQRAPRHALGVLATQVLAALLACAPVWYFHW